MARIRTVKPEFWINEKLCCLTLEAHFLAAALLNYADDEGFFNANPALVKAATSPLRELSGSIPVLLRELSSVGYLRLGKASDGREYGWIIHFLNHQVVNKPTASKIKDLCEFTEDYRSPTVVLPEDSHTEGKGREGKGNRVGDDPSPSLSKPKVFKYPPEFDAWWTVWPKKKSSKAEALGEWNKLAPDAALVAVLIAAVVAQIAAKEAERRREGWAADFKDACRWIKLRMWETEAGDNGTAAKPISDFQRRVKAIEERDRLRAEQAQPTNGDMPEGNE